MSEVKSAMFYIRFCDDCKDLEIIGYDCVKCQLDKVIEAKVDMNLAFVKQIEKLQAAYKEMQKVVEFYGAKESWRESDKKLGISNIIVADCEYGLTGDTHLAGNKAREYLNSDIHKKIIERGEG